MQRIVEEYNCYGCGACVEICPKNCIEMKMSDGGFRYPYIDETRCIDCGKCKSRCIATQSTQENRESKCMIGVHKDEQIWMNSSSGGAFSAIVECLYRENTMIYGVGYDKDLIVKHMSINSLADIHKFRKSKYVQSDLSNTYRDIENKLVEGYRVIFSGTPCQVAGLYAMLGKTYDELYTIDIICTGVTSPRLFKKFIEMLENKYKKKVERLDMRYKIKNGTTWNIGDTQVVFEDGEIKRNPTTRLFRQVYGQKIAYRKSCYNCKFAQKNRGSDITIGDWWGSIEELDGVYEHKGISVMLFNTEKAKYLIDKINDRMNTREIDLSEAILDNPTLSHPTKYTGRCEMFWRDNNKYKANRLFRKYSKPKFTTYILWKLSRLIPLSIRNVIKKIIVR